VMAMMSLATWAALPTSVWMRMYAITKVNDPLPRHRRDVPELGYALCGGCWC
jgi:hypothetical protein